MTVRRFDLGSLGAVERLENGWLRVPGRLTRTGVFVYRNPDGTARRELRRPEEVFHPDALRSFAMVPVTVDHPPVLLDKTNTKQYAVGHVGENLVRDNDYVLASILLTDDEGIVAAETGKQELSCGYTCVLKEGAGSWQGQSYDCEQTNIRGNHVSLVDKGRAGPHARLQLDRLDAVQEAPEERHDNMRKILIDGVWYEVSEQVAQAYEKEEKARKDKLDTLTEEIRTLKADAEKAKAKNDSLTEDLAKEKKARADAEHPDKINAAIKKRIELEKIGLKILGADTKLDALSDKEIKVKVVLASYPSAKLDGVSEDYLQARFDSAVEKISEDKTDEAPHLDTTSTTSSPKKERKDEDPEEIRKRTIKEENERSKKTLLG